MNTISSSFNYVKGLNPDYFLKYHTIHDRSKNTSILRLLCYPPVEEESNDGIIRIEEHTDYGTCTLLLQDSEGGLEVRIICKKIQN